MCENPNTKFLNKIWDELNAGKKETTLDIILFILNLENVVESKKHDLQNEIKRFEVTSSKPFLIYMSIICVSPLFSSNCVEAIQREIIREIKSSTDEVNSKKLIQTPSTVHFHYHCCLVLIFITCLFMYCLSAYLNLM